MWLVTGCLLLQFGMVKDRGHLGVVDSKVHLKWVICIMI
jgi:hypothetical protein